MAGRFGLIALLGIIIAAGVMAGYTYRHGQPVAATIPSTPGPKGPQGPGAHTQTGAGTVTTTTTSMPATAPEQAATTSTETSMSAAPGPKGPRRGANNSGVQVSPGVAAACRNIGNGNSIGQNIKWLFDHHSEFSFMLHEYPENKTIVWIIRGPNKEALETLVTHIEQMECVIEHGGNPRPFDPLFKVDAEISSKYVHTKIEWINDTAIKVIKTADNDCAWLVIKLHAEVVKGFFTTGRIEAQKIHEVPPDALEVCKPYLESS